VTDDDEPDDVAYIGEEDDTRGPGCLILLAAGCSILSFLMLIGTWIWILSAGMIGNIGQPGPAGAAVFFGLGMAMFLLIVAGAVSGFGLGIGTYAARSARQVDLKTAEWTGRSLAIASCVILTASALSVIGLVYLLLGQMR
jgi:hypothetical protein